MTLAGTSAHARPAAPTRTGILVNFAAFQAGWFACVLGAAHGAPHAGAAVAALLVTAHAWRAPRPAQELKLVGLGLLLGLGWDSALLATGCLDFASGIVLPGVAPPWILGLWALFAMTLNVSLAWVKRRLLLGAVLGAVAGPLAYWAGARLGAVLLLEPAFALTALAAGWAVMTPALALAARRYDGMRGGA